MLSIEDPVYLGIDELGHAANVVMAQRSLLLGGEPGAGKSTALHLPIGHAALSHDVNDIVLLDGKQVELAFWRPVATEIVGPDIEHANSVLAGVQKRMDATLDALTAQGRRKVTSAEGYGVIAVDELSLFCSVLGDAKQQKEFSTRLRDVTARGRAAGWVVILATQRPSSDVIPTSLRDLVGYRAAFRCSTAEASDTILGSGWAQRGYSAADISPSAETRGQALLRAEDGLPRLMRAAYLSDSDIKQIAATAAAQRQRKELVAA